METKPNDLIMRCVYMYQAFDSFNTFQQTRICQIFSETILAQLQLCNIWSSVNVLIKDSSPQRWEEEPRWSSSWLPWWCECGVALRWCLWSGGRELTRWCSRGQQGTGRTSGSTAGHTPPAGHTWSAFYQHNKWWIIKVVILFFRSRHVQTRNALFNAS